MKRRVAGYTVLEVIIIMAITVVLFALVVPTFSGRENKARFSQSVNDLNQKIVDVMNDVSTGYFPSTDATCTAPAAGSLMITATNGEQGTRKDCVFLGKVIHANDEDGDGDSNLNIFTVVGRRQVGGEDISVINGAASPTAVMTPDLTETYEVKWSMQVNRIVVLGDPLRDIGAFGLMTDPSAADAKKIDSTIINGSSIDEDKGDTSGAINNASTWNDSSNVNPTQGILLCVFDEVTDSRAGILIGGRAGNAKTEVIFGEENLADLGNNVCGN